MAEQDPAETRNRLVSPHTAVDKATRTQRMFNGIAPRYALINSLFSAGRDAAWRRRAVELAEVGSDDNVLDIACGTGDFAQAFVQKDVAGVVGCDFAHEMLTRAATMNKYKPSDGIKPTSVTIHWCEADALRLPFRSESFSVTSCAFGVRNFSNLDQGLAEMVRVLRPGGRAVLLEFTRPSGRVTRRLYEAYSRFLMPVAATLISGDRNGAYRYLPKSVVSFLNAEQMCARLRQVGFAGVSATPMTGGIVTIYLATRAKG